jgi:hypothetical protein
VAARVQVHVGEKEHGPVGGRFLKNRIQIDRRNVARREFDPGLPHRLEKFRKRIGGVLFFLAGKEHDEEPAAVRFDFGLELLERLEEYRANLRRARAAPAAHQALLVASRQKKDVSVRQHDLLDGFPDAAQRLDALKHDAQQPRALDHIAQ